jgi:hypothetical protein
MKPANTQADAAMELSNNLAELSEEMSDNSMKAEEWEAKKATVISWVSDFEDIMDKAEPIAIESKRLVRNKFRRFSLENEDLTMDTRRDFNKIKKTFNSSGYYANKEMVD